MSSSVTVRAAVRSRSPISSSSKCLRKGWTLARPARRAPGSQVPVIADEHGGRALQGGALQVVHDRRGCRPAPRRHRRGRGRHGPGPAAASRGRSIPWRSRGRPISRRPWYEAVPRTTSRGEGLIGGEQRSRRGCPRRAWPGRWRPSSVVVGHQRGDRAEGLDVVDAWRAVRIVAAEQDGGEEGAALGVGADDLARGPGSRRRSRRPRRARGCGRGPPRAGRGWRAGPCGRARRRDRRSTVLARRSRRASVTRVELGARHEDAADGGAFLPRLDRHLARDLLDEEVELRRAGGGVGAEDRGVEAVGLHGEADRLLDDRRVRAQLAAGRRRSR